MWILSCLHCPQILNADKGIKVGTEEFPKIINFFLKIKGPFDTCVYRLKIVI